MTDPHSGSESLAADVAEGQHHSVLSFFNGEKVTRQVTHREDLARDVKRSVVNETRRTQTPVHLRCFEDRRVQLRVVPLQRLELRFEFGNRS